MEYKETIKCKICENEFIDYIYRHRKFCSRKCRNKSMFGNIFGRFLKGKKFSETHKNNIRLSKLRDKNPLWKGGQGEQIGKIAYDDYNLSKICQICNTKKDIQIHHKDKNRYNNKIENLIILCRSCHSKQHRGVEWSINIRKT